MSIANQPGGMLFLSSINRTLLSGALAIGAAEYLLRIVPPGMPFVSVMDIRQSRQLHTWSLMTQERTSGKSSWTRMMLFAR